jgi:hypothetical protein
MQISMHMDIHLIYSLVSSHRSQVEPRNITMKLPAAFLLVFVMARAASAYTSPQLDRRAMAGVWRLTGKSSLPTTATYPIKEFTTYPKKPSPPPEEYLLMLKEDGSFQQYDERQKIKSEIMANMRGTWDYLDGQLILAADRTDGDRQVHDTMLVGTVVAKSQESLIGNPVLAHEEKDDNIASALLDTHLSVPKGAVKVGKFMYPKKHKMFFEQLMFNPLSMGSFELKQVLGNLNAAVDKETEKLIELFRKSDFSGKKFLLTNYPIPERKPKGDLRWSIKYNRFVDDPIKSKKQEEQENNQTTEIRVMELQLFANNTFSTTAGLGDSILRGKWWIIGDDRDQLMMQVLRFGFGRSVSGSTFSEGRMLSHDDAKTYWGRISHVNENESNDEIDGFDPQEKSIPNPEEDGDEPRRLQVKGSVIVGWGHEPQPVARFIMREELEEEEDNEDGNGIELQSSMPQDPPDDDGLDWSRGFQ